MLHLVNNFQVFSIPSSMQSSSAALPYDCASPVLLLLVFAVFLVSVLPKYEIHTPLKLDYLWSGCSIFHVACLLVNNNLMSVQIPGVFILFIICNN